MGKETKDGLLAQIMRAVVSDERKKADGETGTAGSDAVTASAPALCDPLFPSCFFSSKMLKSY